MLYRIPTLRKVRNSTADIFLEIFKFFGQAISENSFKPLIVKVFYLLRMSDDYCLRRAVQGQLSQCNSRNTATFLRAIVKSQKALKGTKVFACECSGRNLKNFSKFAGKSPCWSKVVAWNSLWKSQSCSVNFIKKEAPTESTFKYFPVSFEKNMNTSAWLPLKYCNVKESDGYLEFTYVFFINKCSSLHQNNSDPSGEAW